MGWGGRRRGKSWVLSRCQSTWQSKLRIATTLSPLEEVGLLANAIHGGRPWA